MEKAISILEEIKDIIKQQEQTFSAFVNYHLPKINTHDALQFIETEINKGEIIETHIPELNIAIEISQDWLIKDDIKISPQEAPKILRTKKVGKIGLTASIYISKTVHNCIIRTFLDNSNEI